ncbi:MAG: Ig-like domain-containing protein [Candidatus Marinimicrobia bacterium]|jgi:hypothetical protein|nr:Ig-like domain-containing protein [Candidatus Neomarinimicrobiota bacterium]MDP6936925.1 Ig-like domain-containing protein [Candidatus Neomarinimicrobiota bacterium]
MKFLNRTYLWIIPILFGCAAQGPASGGPPDSDGPAVISMMPQSGTIHIPGDQKISLVFNEMLDPVSVPSSVTTTLEEEEYHIKVRGRKIYISPTDQWPPDNVIRFTLSRKIRDYQNNMMAAPVEVILSTGDTIPEGEIWGSLKNYDKENLVETGLFVWPITDSSRVYQKIEVNKEGNFHFRNIHYGRYIVAAIEGGISIVEKQMQTKKYALNSVEYIHLHSNNPSDSIQLYYSDPVEKLKITSIEMVSQYSVKLLMNDNSEELFIVDSLLSPEDSVTIQLGKSNRLEHYSLPEYSFILPSVLDTLPPAFVTSVFEDDLFQIVFNEPVHLSPSAVTTPVDTLQEPLQFKQLNETTIIFPNLADTITKLQLTGAHIVDWAGNQFKDSIKTVSVFYPPKPEPIVGGNILGNIDYADEHPIMVEALHLEKQTSYFSESEKGKYALHNIPAGHYKIWAFEDLHELDSTVYFSGLWSPYKRAAKFTEYPDTVDVRARWDVEGINLKIE